MPIYEYQCRGCEHEFETIQKISEPVLTQCPVCGKDLLKKKISAVAFRLKGGGWYETDFKSGDKRNVAAHDDGGDSKSTGSSASSDGKADSKEGGSSASKSAGEGSSTAASNGSSSSSSKESPKDAAKPAKATATDSASKGAAKSETKSSGKTD
jgi:putative FmdB family regulatory protein